MAHQIDADASGWRFAQCFGDKTESNEDITEVSFSLVRISRAMMIDSDFNRYSGRYHFNWWVRRCAAGIHEI